ncbi:MAG: hypothetical protein J6D30_04780 [Clostridia bacterium]|nr:hypothetical protein [Clostridia bacterium]
MDRVISKFECMVIEKTSRKGVKYRVLVTVVGGKEKQIAFLNDELEFALFKADIKTK